MTTKANKPAKKLGKFSLKNLIYDLCRF